MPEWKGEGCRDRAVADSGGLRENCCELNRVASVGSVQFSSKEIKFYHLQVWLGEGQENPSSGFLEVAQ